MNESDDVSYFELLPEEVTVEHILSALAPRDLAAFGATCEFNRRVSNDSHLWKRICAIELSPSFRPQRLQLAAPSNWRAWYVQHRVPVVSIQALASRVVAMRERSVLAIGRSATGNTTLLRAITRTPSFAAISHTAVREDIDAGKDGDDIRWVLHRARHLREPAAVLCSAQSMPATSRMLEFKMVLAFRDPVAQRRRALWGITFCAADGWHREDLDHWMDRLGSHDCLGYDFEGSGPFILRQ